MVFIIIAITALTFMASLIGFVTGFGTGTYMAPLILFGIPYKKALLFVCIVHWFNDIWKIGFFVRSIDIPLVLYFGLPGIVASAAGALIVISEPSEHLAQIMSLFLVIYGFILLCNPTFVFPATRSAAFLGGTVSGFLAGIFGMRGALKSSFLAPFNLSPECYLATIGTTSLLIDTVRMITYWYGSITLSPLLTWSLFFCIPTSYGGALLGKKLVLRIPQKKFRALLAVSLIIIGIWIFLVIRPGILL